MKTFLIIFSLFICHNIYSFQEALKNSPITKNALESFMFSWTAVFGYKENNHYEVDAIHLNGNSRLKLFAVSEDEKILISTTYISRDKWHVIEEDQRTVYRPFEANYKLAKTYYYLMKSKLQFLNSTNLKLLGKYDGQQDRQYHFYVQLNQAEKESIRHQINIIKNKLIPNAPSRAEKHFYLRKVKSLFDFIKKGKKNTVASSGVITRLDNPDGVVEITNLKLTTVINDELLTPKGKFENLTSKPDWKNVAFFSFNGTWQPGRPTITKDCRFLNLTTGEVRRLAFKGTLSTPQAIDRQKSHLYFTGSLPGSTAIRPFIHNFQTGVTKPIGPREVHKGRIEQIALSANRERLAILHNPQPHLGDLRQLIVLNLKSKSMHTYKLQGNPQRLCWHPDNKSIFYSHISKPYNKTLISLFSPGKIIEDIIEGIYPSLTHDGKSLMFLDLKDQLWKSCSLNGSQPTVYQKGLPTLQFPSWKTSQEGLFIKHSEENWPIPVVYDIKKQETKSVIDTQALWLTPIW